MKTFLLLFISVFFISCSGEKVSKDANTEERAQISSIERQQQRIQRYDCDRRLTSDQVETVNSVSQIYNIKPDETKNLWSFRAHNETTDSGAGHLNNNRGVFTLDLAPTVFNIYAKKGVNKIHYSFFYCDETVNNPENQEISCVHSPELREEGNVFINIKYSVRRIEGTNVIRPTVDECQPD